jgi:hypothetical protein
MGRTGESYTTARGPLQRVRARRALTALPDAELVARCAAPIVALLRVADPAARADAIRRLTGARCAVLAFSLVEGHAGGGLVGLCTELPHRLVQDGFWTLLESGFRQVDDSAMIALLRRLRREVACALAAAGVPDEVGREGELDRESFLRVVEAMERLDPDLVSRLDDEYRSLVPRSLRRVAQHIRAHAGEFVTAPS